jgi:hypothetical protein
MRSETLAIALPLLIVLGTILYLVLRNLVRVWLDHRVRMGLLEKLEHRPELMAELPDLKEILEGPARQQEERRRQSYIWTGIFLALIGSSCALFAHLWLSGGYASGLYFGGVVCVPLGFVLTLLGLAMKLLSRTPLPANPAAR